jgi:hypothetical protein
MNKNKICSGESGLRVDNKVVVVSKYKQQQTKKNNNTMSYGIGCCPELGPEGCSDAVPDSFSNWVYSV